MMMDEDFAFFDDPCCSLLDDVILGSPSSDPNSPFNSLTSGEYDSSCDDTESSNLFHKADTQILATQSMYNQINHVSAGTELPSSSLPQPSQQPSKKRKLEQGTEIILPRDVLKKTSFQELDEQVKQVTQVRDLTPAEEYAVSRQRRLIKNREYANTARTKKKIESDHLREENEKLKNEMQVLQYSVNNLQLENQRLRSENTQFRLALGNSGIPCPTLTSQPVQPTNCFFPSPSTPKTTINTIKMTNTPFTTLNYITTPQPAIPASTSTRPNGMTTVLLFVCLFSFAVFFLPPTVFSSIPGLESQANQGGAARRLFGAETDIELSVPNVEPKSRSFMKGLEQSEQSGELQVIHHLPTKRTFAKIRQNQNHSETFIRRTKIEN